MKYVFGPVPSRRLGQSLGIDPIPFKTCNWNCVYCQLGRSKPLVNERKEYFPSEKILTEVDRALKSHQPGEIDWVTFIGSGETALHANIGWLIQQVKLLTNLPVAAITNGSLLYLPEMRAALGAADAILPSLDAGNAQLYRKINRPHPEATFERLLNGLATFRHEYSGKLWVEIMLVGGLNDSEEALRGLAVALQLIRPDEIHLNLPTRPPAETWVQPPDDEGLFRARAILGDTAQVVLPTSGVFGLGESDTLVDAIINIISRHPMRENELIATLEHWSPGDVTATLQKLKLSGQVQRVERYGVRFWIDSHAFFPT